jgi:hypothetical protein
MRRGVLHPKEEDGADRRETVAACCARRVECPYLEVLVGEQARDTSDWSTVRDEKCSS